MSGYPNVLKYYIWGFQVHFRISCQVTAEGVFNHFDRGLQPIVSILGFNKNNEQRVIFFEPENLDSWEHYFADIDDKALKHLAAHPDKDLHYTGEGQQELRTNSLRNECFRLAVEQTLNENRGSDNRMYFSAQSVTISGFVVFVILSLNKDVYLSHQHLQTRFFAERHKVSRSILEATVGVFLRDCAQCLLMPNPGSSSYNGRTSEEILRESARQFMYAVSTKGQVWEGMHSLFNACNELSTHRYEGKENKGHLIIAREGDESIEYTIKLENPFRLADIKKTRKLLQLADENIGVVCNSYQILGLGKVKDTYRGELETVFSIRFRSIYCWDIMHANQSLLVMKYGMPFLQSQVIRKIKFLQTCRRVFQGISDGQAESLYALSVATTFQKNGALLIITADAINEAKRLKTQCLPIEPVKLDEELAMSLTAIDGAVLVDQDGVAYAYGAILDGNVTDKGDSARGARYNSAITYIEFQKKRTSIIILIVSEDGMVDILPDLTPMISRSEIAELLSMLAELDKNFDVATYNKVMELLTAREFYLSKDQCDSINSMKRNAENLSWDVYPIKIKYRDLHPNAEMNESYFLD